MKASDQITKRIKETKDWRGVFLARLRKLIHEADPEITEEWKWDSPIFAHNGLVCGVSAFKDHVGVNFFKGASLKDPGKLFKSGLDAKAMRTIKLFQGDKINDVAFKNLVRAGVAQNSVKKK